MKKTISIKTVIKQHKKLINKINDMKEVKIRYVLENIHTGKVHFKWYTISQIELKGIARLFDIENYKIIARDYYTGLKDKNGTEIYSGDIFGGIINFKWLVIFENASFMLKKIGRLSGIWSNISRLFDSDMQDIYELVEVIGNIHQNPEFLK